MQWILYHISNKFCCEVIALLNLRIRHYFESKEVDRNHRSGAEHVKRRGNKEKSHINNKNNV